MKRAIAYFNENINSFDLVDTHMVLRTPPVLRGMRFSAVLREDVGSILRCCVVLNPFYWL